MTVLNGLYAFKRHVTLNVHFTLGTLTPKRHHQSWIVMICLKVCYLFSCLSSIEYADVKCNSLWAANRSRVDTDHKEGVIQSLSYGPWYDAGSTCTVHIQGPDVYKVRYFQIYCCALWISWRGEPLDRNCVSFRQSFGLQLFLFPFLCI